MTDLMSLIQLCAGVVLGSSVLPGLMWWLYRRPAQAQWPPHKIGAEVVSSGQYREAVVPSFSAEGPPMDVKIAALGAWGLGQMFLPGLALGLFGLIVLVGVVSIPGLILAWKLFFLGKPLLNGEHEAAEKARGLATFATVLNVIVLVVTALLSLFAIFGNRGSFTHNLLSTAMLAGPTALYAVISLVHASYLRKAAAAIDANAAAQDAERATGVRVHAGDVPVSIDAPHEVFASASDVRAQR